jgi:LAO/AO transport system kinase
MTAVDQVQLAQRVASGDRQALAQAITIAESTRADHRRATTELLKTLGTVTHRSTRVGISGVPGVGKSTLIDALGCHIVAQGHRPAVLTVDPSSARSGGSILGDKTRMPNLSQCGEAYIRPSPTSGALGGVGRHTRETIQLCEAAGFDIVLVETVGVGQSEYAVSGMTDVFLLLLLPAGGDELQGIKRGIMELADVVMVNKADGVLEQTARGTAADYANAIRLLKPRSNSWAVPVEAGSALQREGIDRIWSQILACASVLNETGELQARRAEQSLTWMWDDTIAALKTKLESDESLRPTIVAMEAQVRAGTLTPTAAAERLVSAFLNRRE